jgi:hypothetical protein
LVPPFEGSPQEKELLKLQAVLFELLQLHKKARQGQGLCNSYQLS